MYRQHKKNLIIVIVDRLQPVVLHKIIWFISHIEDMVLFCRQLCEVVVNATVIWQFFYKRLYLFLRIERKERI